MRRILNGAAATMLALAPLVTTPLAHSDVGDLSDVDAKVGKSLVYIQIEYDAWVQLPASAEADGTTKWSDEVKSVAGCTGVIVDPAGFIATAAHCVDPTFSEAKQGIYQQLFSDMKLSDDDVTKMTNQAVNGEWPIEGKQPGTPIDRTVSVIQQGQGAVITQGTTAQVIDFQPVDNGDNALLKVLNEPPLQALPVADKAPAPGTNLVSVGFPGAIGNAMDMSRMQAPTYLTGTASSSQVTPSGAAQTEVTAAISNGMSGGPTVDTHGVVVGLNDMSYGADNGANSNFITDAATLHAFLGKNNVQLVPATPPPPPVPPAKPFPWILVSSAGAAAILVIAGVLVLVTRRKKTPTLQPDFAGRGYPPPTAVPPPVDPPAAPPAPLSAV